MRVIMRPDLRPDMWRRELCADMRTHLHIHPHVHPHLPNATLRPQRSVRYVVLSATRLSSISSKRAVQLHELALLSAAPDIFLFVRLP